MDKVKRCCFGVSKKPFEIVMIGLRDLSAGNADIPIFSKTAGEPKSVAVGVSR